MNNINDDIYNDLKEIKCKSFKANLARLVTAYKYVQRLKKVQYHCCVSNIITCQQYHILEDLENICDKNAYMIDQLEELIKELTRKDEDYPLN